MTKAKFLANELTMARFAIRKGARGFYIVHADKPRVTVECGGPFVTRAAAQRHAQALENEYRVTAQSRAVW